MSFGAIGSYETKDVIILSLVQHGDYKSSIFNGFDLYSVQDTTKDRDVTHTNEIQNTLWDKRIRGTDIEIVLDQKTCQAENSRHSDLTL